MRLAQERNGQRPTYVQDLVSLLPNVLAESTGSATTHYLLGLSQIGQLQDDQTQWLLDDALGSVRQAVEELVSVLGEGGGYILGPSHAIQAGTPPENIAAMFDAVASFHPYRTNTV